MSLIDRIFGRVVVQLLYCLPIPGLTLKLAPVLNRQYPVTQDNDCIFIQAFGRNAWKDDQLLRILEENGAQLAADPMIALQCDGFDPGQSNRDLAALAWQLFFHHPIHIFAQWEVAYAMWELRPREYNTQLAFTNFMHVLWPRGAYYPTWEVKKDSIARAASLGLHRPIELAHPDMLARSVMIIWRLGLRPSLDVSLIPYDANSVQSWTTSSRRWWFRNALGHAHHILHRWVWLSPPKVRSSAK